MTSRAHTDDELLDLTRSSPDDLQARLCAPLCVAIRVERRRA